MNSHAELPAAPVSAGAHLNVEKAGAIVPLKQAMEMVRSNGRTRTSPEIDLTTARPR